jgi:hypothetical protein
MWQCKLCNEKLEDSFDSCWSCGHDKKGKKIILESSNEKNDEIKSHLFLKLRNIILLIIFAFLVFLGLSDKKQLVWPLLIISILPIFIFFRKTGLTDKMNKSKTFKNIFYGFIIIFISSSIHLINPYSKNNSLAGDYCYPNCEDPQSAIKLNTNGTFNSSTKSFGGMSTWGNWNILSDRKIKLTTTRISTDSNSDKIPPPQNISLMSNGNIKIGSTIYYKSSEPFKWMIHSIHWLVSKLGFVSKYILYVVAIPFIYIYALISV